MPQPRKPAERRQRKADRSQEGTVRTRDAGNVVALPIGTQAGIAATANLDWAAEVQEAWVELWSSPLVACYKPTDMPALRRLFDLRDRLIDVQRKFDEEPTVAGSMGQLTLSPWAAEVHRVAAEVERLEDRFGLTPMSRLRLGVTYEEGVSLAARNAQLLESFRQGQARR